MSLDVIRLYLEPVLNLLFILFVISLCYIFLIFQNGINKKILSFVTVSIVSVIVFIFGFQISKKFFYHEIQRGELQEAQSSLKEKHSEFLRKNELNAEKN